jgi:hypothetical protein
MRNERPSHRFRGAMLAIAGMVTVSAVGAMFSCLLVESSLATPSFAGAAVGAGSRGGWPRPDDAVDRLVSTQLFQEVAAWTGLSAAGQDDPRPAAFLDPIETAEIVVPLLTLLVVVTAAQRFAESGPRRVRNSPQTQHRLAHEATLQQLPRHGADLGPRRLDLDPWP